MLEPLTVIEAINNIEQLFGGKDGTCKHSWIEEEALVKCKHCDKEIKNDSTNI